jgi:RNA polymerase sigma-70 factor (ECF subfamily)
VGDEPAGDDERSLVARSRGGDRAAFEELVRRTGRLVYARLVLETNGDSHRAEDLAQETFLIAWRSVAQVSDAASFRPWLIAIASRVAIDAARRDARKKRGGRKAASGGELTDLVDGSASGPAETVARDDERQRLLSVLRGLPEPYRVPLSLRYLAGADYDTIARQLALTNGSLRGLLHRGLAMLRAELERGERRNAKPAPSAERRPPSPLGEGGGEGACEGRDAPSAEQ